MELSRHPKSLQKLLVFKGFFRFSLRGAKMLPKCSQVGHLGRQVGQLSPILAATWRPCSLKWGSWGPTWRQLGHFWASRGRPKSAKIDKGSKATVFRPKVDLDFFKFSVHFSIVFRKIFTRFVYRFCFFFFRISETFLKVLLERSSRRSRRKGAPVSARRASSIS